MLGLWDPMETIIQDRYEDILFLKTFCFLLLNMSWPVYQSAGRHYIARGGDQPLTCSIVDMALWWRKRGEGGVPARGG